MPTDPLETLMTRLDVRVGTDVQPIGEVADAVRQHGARYLERVFTAHEVDSCGGPQAPPESLAPGLAARFAAKEATIKLLRPATAVPGWREIVVRRHPAGWTDVELSGTAAELARAARFARLSLSISHGGDVGMATVIAVGLSGDVPTF